MSRCNAAVIGTQGDGKSHTEGPHNAHPQRGRFPSDVGQKQPTGCGFIKKKKEKKNMLMMCRFGVKLERGGGL